MVRSPLAAHARRKQLLAGLCRLAQPGAAAWVLLGWLAFGCGEDVAAPAQAAPGGIREVQEAIDEAAWQATVGEDASLAGLAANVGLPFQAAGKLGDSLGNTIRWAEFAAKPDDPRTAVVALFRACDKAGKCTAGKATHTATGAELQDAAGQPVASLVAGEPVLLKHLQAHKIDSDPTILGALERSHVVDDATALERFGLVRFGERRFVVLNAYGPHVGVTLAEIRAAATKTGLFDTVEVLDYARRRDVDRLLLSLTPLDVVVWLGAGVVENYKDGKPSRPVGMTVSRGVLGDELYHYKYLDNLLDAPPLGGPGLVVLAGAQTLGADYYFDKATLVPHLYLSPYRPVVGFGGSASLAEVSGAVARLLGDLGAGKDLETAMKSAGKGLTAQVISPMDPTARAAWRIPVANAKFWDKTPSAVALKLHVNGTPWCVVQAATCDADGYKTAWQQAGNQVAAKDLDSSRTAVFDCKPTFKGPYFECTQDNALTSAKFWLKGVMLGRDVGSRFLVYAQGTTGEQFKDITVLGEGEIEKTDPAGGTTRLYFGGIAAMSPYVDPEGRCCKMGSPRLKTYDSQASEMVLSH